MSIELQEARPPYVRFERRAVEDRTKSIEEGIYATKDVDFALITPPYSRDCIEQAVTDWLAILEDQVKQERIPRAWADKWKDAYEAFKRGEEVPEDGVPVKTWPVLSPAQRQNLLTIGIRTVEDVAAMNDEGMRRFGMGALDLKNKAVAWLKSAKDSGVVTQENAALKARVDQLETQLLELMETNKQLMSEVETKRGRKAA